MMNTHHTTAAIILAAGASTRMGGGHHKLLLPLGDRPVLAHVIDAALASQARPIVLVLGHETVRVRAHLPSYTGHPDIIIIDNPDYLQGMSTSMKLGVQTLIDHGYMKYDMGVVDSALFLTGDQPLITAQIINSIIQAYTAYRQENKRIIAPLYGGQRGNPALFDASLFDELLQVTGDEGGRGLLKRHPDEVVTIETGNQAASYDVDTWEAYQQVLRAWDDLKSCK
jgi:molybdenum cofactor cytidylyltransferase